MNIKVAGIGMTDFGELWNMSPRRLSRQAVSQALRDAGLEGKDIEALFVGNMLSGMLGGQEHTGALFAEELGLSVPSMKVEGACSSGGLAVHAAVLSILSGQYETVLVLGIEKMTDHKPESVATALMGAGSSEERRSGATFPGLYAMLARAHMDAFGTTEEEMAAVSVKNHFHASFHPHAHFHKEITVAQVMKSAKIADPLKLLDCSPVSDGAAAIILSKKDIGRRAVNIVASKVATDTLGLSARASLTELKASREASSSALKQAGISIRDVQVAEVHDCFSIAEILAVEDIGIFEKGRAGKAIADGETTVGSKKTTVVNPSGGLKGCGHPVGATGVKQIVEITEQLRGEAKKRQVDDVRYGLTHNVGGSGATCVVHVLERQFLL